MRWSPTKVGLSARSVAGAIVVAAAAVDTTARRLSNLHDRTLRWLGQRSYGIYLWHWPIMVGLDVARAPDSSLVAARRCDRAHVADRGGVVSIHRATDSQERLARVPSPVCAPRSSASPRWRLHSSSVLVPPLNTPATAAVPLPSVPITTAGPTSAPGSTHPRAVNDHRPRSRAVSGARATRWARPACHVRWRLGRLVLGYPGRQRERSSGHRGVQRGTSCMSADRRRR